MTKTGTPALVWVCAAALLSLRESFRFFQPYLNLSAFYPPAAWNLRFAAVWAVHGLRALGAAAFFWSCYALGKRFFPRQNLSAPARAGLGLALWSFIGFALTALGLADPIKLRAASFLILAALVYSERTSLRGDWSRGWSSIKDFFRPISIPSAAIAFSIILAWFASLTPEVFSDTLHYVLPVPQAYLRAGHFVDMAGQAFTRFPRLPSMIYLWGLAWGDDRFCKLINVGAGCLWAGAAGAWAARLWGRRAGLWAAAFLLGCPIVAGYMWSATNDIFCALFVLLAFVLWMSAWSSDDARARSLYFLLAGLMAGAGGASKYVAFFAFPFFAVDAARRFFRGERISVRASLLFACGALLPLLPWWALNGVWTGNPLYPYFSGVGNVDPLQQKLFSYMRDDFRHIPGFWERFVLPINLSVKGIWFSRDGFLGPALLMLLPLAGFAGGKEKGWKTPALLFLGTTWLCFALAAGKLRYLMPALGVAFALAGGVMARLTEDSSAGRNWFKAAGAAVLLVQFLCLALAFHLFLKGGEILSGRWTASDYVRTPFGSSNIHPPQDAYDFLARQGVTSKDKIYLIGETRTYRCPGDAFANSLYDVPLYVRWRRADPRAEAAADALRRDGFRYVLVNRPLLPLSVLPEFRTDDWMNWLESAFDELGIPVYQDDYIVIYKTA